MIIQLNDYRNNLKSLERLCIKQNIQILISNSNHSDTFIIKEVNIKGDYFSKFYAIEKQDGEHSVFFTSEINNLNNQYKLFLENQISTHMNEEELKTVIFEMHSKAYLQESEEKILLL